MSLKWKMCPINIREHFKFWMWHACDSELSFSLYKNKDCSLVCWIITAASFISELQKLKPLLRCDEGILPVFLRAGWFVFPPADLQHFCRKAAINVTNEWLNFSYSLKGACIQRGCVCYLTAGGCRPSTRRCRLGRLSVRWPSSNRRCKRPQRHLSRGRTERHWKYPHFYSSWTKMS